jgi:hypothetical protein
LKSVRDALSRAAGGAGGSSPNVVLPASRMAAPVPAGGSLGSHRPAMPTSVGSGAAPATRVASGATEAVPSQIASSVTAEMQATYWGLRTLKVVVSLATLAVPLAFALSFLIGGGAIRPEIVQDTSVQRFMDAIVGPVLETAGKVLTFRTVVDGWNLLLPVMAIVAIVLRRLVPFLRAERWAKMRIARATKTETRGASISTAPKVTDQRMAMLREYAETKKLLFQQKRRLAFVSIDVLNSARLKAGEDKLVLEHAYAEYRKYAERVLAANNVWKLTWQGETVLCVFFTIDTAVRAAQQMVGELAWFNDGIHQLRHKFEVRCGVSMGDVVFPEDKRIEDVSDEALDRSGRRVRVHADRRPGVRAGSPAVDAWRRCHVPRRGGSASRGSDPATGFRSRTAVRHGRLGADDRGRRCGIPHRRRRRHDRTGAPPLD